MDIGYDLIGDIHGHCNELVKLLKHLGYHDSPTGYQHPNRKVIFLGDFIDRGEKLREHKSLLNLVMTMVRNDHAMAVMGNHEFNALAFHTEHNGLPLRPHTPKNIKQHKAFLNEYNDDPIGKQEVLEFFMELPLWIEFDNLRIVHACWHDEYIQWANAHLPERQITPEFLVEASTKGTMAYKAIETLLKGVEVKLPDGITFADKDGHTRSEVRVQWWRRDARTLGDVALPFGVDIGHAADLDIPSDIPVYPSNASPCFIGHYWLHGEPSPLAPNIACLDYSIAKDGKLVAYRWNGETVLKDSGFTYSEAPTHTD